MVSPSHTSQGTQFGQEATLTQVGRYPLSQVPIGGMNAEIGQPMGLIWVHSLFSTSDLWIYLIKNSMTT